MQQSLQQRYQHLVQQHIARRECFPRKAPRDTRPDGQARARATAREEENMAWEVGGVLALVAAATFCGVLAQAHLG